MARLYDNQSGYIALIAVVIIVSVGLAIGLSLNILGINTLRVGLIVQQSEQSLAAAETCLQEGYLRLRYDPDYNEGNLMIGDGSCSISISGAGPRRTLIAIGTVHEVIQRIESKILLGEIGDPVTVESWQLQ